ncbi:hypothetical protein M8J77_016887 [Diaphorina citri]|nr:hypothetical protein M8J77_016887 [Diaphorina citri]
MKLFGSLPYRINSSNFANPSKKIISLCSIGRLLSYGFLVINLIVVYDNIKFTIAQFKIHKSCLEDICFGPICRNICAHMVIIWMIDLQNVTSIVNVLYCRKLRTLYILNKSVRMAALLKIKLPIASISVIVFVLVQVIAFFFQWTRAYFAWWYFEEFVLTYSAMACTLSANNLISLFLLIMEFSYKEITRQLTDLSNVSLTRTVLISTKHVHRIRLIHWEITSIIKHISSCFAFDMLIESVTSTVRVIYFMFLILRFLTEAFYSPSKSSTFSIFQSIVFLISVVGKFVYLCYRCNRVVQEVSTL